MTDKVEFECDLDALPVYETTNSKNNGSFRVTRIPQGFIWEVWAYDPTPNDWIPTGSFFVPTGGRRVYRRQASLQEAAMSDLVDRLRYEAETHAYRGDDALPNAAADEIERRTAEGKRQAAAFDHLVDGLLQVLHALQVADGKIFEPTINEIGRHIDEAREILSPDSGRRDR